MYTGSLPFALPLLAIAVVTAGIACYAFIRSKQSGALTFGWLMTAMTVWSAFNAFEFLAPTLPEKIFFAKLEYLGIAAISPLWLVFALTYTGHARWLTRGRRMALLAYFVLTFGLAFTNEYHHLIWQDVALDPGGFPSLYIASHGLYFWICTVIAYILILAGITSYLNAYTKTHRLFRQQISIMVAGSIIPLIGNTFTLISPLRSLDLTPFTFAFSSFLLAIGLFRFNLINLVPIAGEIVIENLLDAVIVMDAQQRIVDMNSAARKWLNAGDDLIGQSAREKITWFETVWEQWGEGKSPITLAFAENERSALYEINISAIQDLNKTALGTVIIARNITREQELLTTEHRNAWQMEILNSITLASLETNTFQELLQILADRLNKLLEADGVFITLWDEAEKKAVPTAAYGELRESYSTQTYNPVETILTEHVINTGHALAVNDVFNTPYLHPNIAKHFPSQSILALPLATKEHKIGAALITFNQPHLFDEQEVALGEQAAAQIALALHKAQLLDSISHRVVQLNLLDEVSRQMTQSLDENEICVRTVQAIVNVFGYDEAAISLLKENELELIAVGGVVDMGFNPGFRQNVGQGIVGLVAETRQYYFSKNITLDPHYYHPSSIGVGSALGTPIIYEDQLIGVVYVQSGPPNPIVPDDIITMQTLSSHLAIAIRKAHVYAEARDNLTSMTTLQSVTETVTSSLELDKIFKTVVQLLKETYGYTYVSIYLLDGLILKLGAQAGYPEELIIHEIPINAGITGRTVRTRQTQFIDNVRNDPTFLIASYEVDSEICVPLLKNDNLLGVLNIESAPSRPLTSRDVDFLISVAGPVSMAVDNAQLHAKATSLALTDGMTGLFNRRAFDQNLETELVRAERYVHPLSLIILDMDAFKEYNDTYGHPAGDERLKAIANILLENMRDPDVAARYGGEEFAIILPHTTKEGALALAERLRESAESQWHGRQFDHAYIPGYTISLGVATYPQDGLNADTLLRAADNAENTAKKLGKNRICAAVTPQKLTNE